MNPPSPESQTDTDIPKQEPQKSTVPNTPRCKSGRWFVLGLGLGIMASFSLLFFPQLLPDAIPFITSQPQPSERASLPPTPSLPPRQPIMDAQAAHDLQAQMHQLQQQLASINEVQQQMQSLSQDLQQVQQSQQQIRAAQSSVELMQLHSRLSWILHPASHLPQMRLAWEEIVLLPSLSPEQHQQASQMLALAQKRSEDMAHWQQTLSRVLAYHAIQAKQSHNLLADWLPTTGTLAPLSQWLLQQFNIHPVAQTMNAQYRAQHEQLRRMQQQLAQEQWPEPRAWATLRSQVQLQILQHDKQREALDLPEDFTPIQHDLTQLRDTARQWLQESTHED